MVNSDFEINRESCLIPDLSKKDLLEIIKKGGYVG
jgi:hypothetical protein